MSVSPFLPRLARARRRPALLLGLLLVAAALIPFITHGAGASQTEPAPRHLRRAVAVKGETRAPEFVPGHVLVRFASESAAQGDETTGGGRSSGRAMLLDAGGEQINAQVERFEGSDIVKGLRIAYVAPDETLAAVEAFRSRDDVLYAEPDYVRHATNLPNETEFTNMWALKNVGQFIVDRFNSGPNGICPTAPATPCTFSGAISGADIKMEQAWNITTGSPNIVVGVVDEGIDINHPDLKDNIFTNPSPGAISGYVNDVHGWNFAPCTTGSPIGCGSGASNSIFAGNGTYPTDETDAHGTHVAGTIGASGNNGQGVVGINWNVKIMPLKFIDAAGNGSSSNAIRAEAYAKAMRDLWVKSNGNQGANIRVLNNSYGGGGASQAELDSINSLAASQILFVVAAGNESANSDVMPSYPANYNAPNLISVAATTRRDLLDTSYTNYGARTVHIAAPGSLILSTTPNNTYDFYYGTSMATPHVSGVAALALAAASDTSPSTTKITVQQLRNLILLNGDASSSMADKVYSQRRLNAFGTVQAALKNDTTPPAPANNLRVAGQLGRFTILNFIAPGDNGNTGNAALYEISFTSATNGLTYVLKTAVPNGAGGGEAFNVNVPLRQTSGTIRVRTLDNVGNESSATVGVNVDAASADPYTTNESGNAGLAPIGTTALGFHADDSYRTVSLPAGFSFPFFGQQNTSVVVSSNGNIYLQPLSTLPPVNPPDQNGDSGSSTQQLEGFRMIAGLWDDLRTDCTGNGSGSPCDVYMNTTSDPNKVIFRWEARTFNSVADNGNPVEFEIELNRDGTIQERYGAGNTGVFPVVGIGAGEQGGSYIINSHTYPNATSLSNAQTVTFAPRSAGGTQGATIQFSSASFNTSEDDTENTPRATITVTRTGDTSGTSSVSYRTVDDASAVRCDATNGVAFARCDYTTTVGTLTFNAGESSKTFTVPIIDDSFVEGTENFQVQLSNPSGATLGTPSTATVSISDNDIFSTANPIFNTDFFVRQQYLDFLSREPEAGQPWSATLNNCRAGDTSCDRISVSANFFRSQEFQLKGLFVFRFYKVAFNRLPLYSEIIPDMASVT
ncbi:MAG: hypothetical protein QOE33_3360, partial [Acidobacteriota bacterium]|nr:hypothetical protein [Acidobacteriota bacterium]